MDSKWVAGVGTLLVIIVISTALLMARVGDTLDAINNAQDCIIELFLTDNTDRTIETVREKCPPGSLPERAEE